MVTYGYNSLLLLNHEWFFTPLLKYKSIPVKISNDKNSNKLYLMNMKTKEAVCDIPNEDIIDSSGCWIDKDNIFWTASYDKEKQRVVVKS